VSYLSARLSGGSNGAETAQLQAQVSFELHRQLAVAQSPHVSDRWPDCVGPGRRANGEGGEETTRTATAAAGQCTAAKFENESG